jgi:hypothetical protein
VAACLLLTLLVLRQPVATLSCAVLSLCDCSGTPLTADEALSWASRGVAASVGAIDAELALDRLLVNPLLQYLQPYVTGYRKNIRGRSRSTGTCAPSSSTIRLSPRPPHVHARAHAARPAPTQTLACRTSISAPVWRGVRDPWR